MPGGNAVDDAGLPAARWVSGSHPPQSELHTQQYASGVSSFRKEGYATARAPKRLQREN